MFSSVLPSLADINENEDATENKGRTKINGETFNVHQFSYFLARKQPGCSYIRLAVGPDRDEENEIDGERASIVFGVSIFPVVPNFSAFFHPTVSFSFSWESQTKKTKTT